MEPIGHWTFDEASSGTGTGTVVDSSGGGNDGTINGGALYEPGVVGTGALSFDGTDDFVDVGVVPDLDLTGGSYTIAFWAKQDISQLGRIVNMDDGGLPLDGYSVFASGNMRITHSNGSANDFNVPSPFGVWSHTAAVYDSVGQTLTLYIDGVAAGSIAIAGGDLTSDGNDPLWFGGIPCCASQRFEGSLDDIRLYDVALSAGEINDLIPTYYVCPSGCSFATIQSAIDVASPGDVIDIAPGTYNEVLYIASEVTLQGPDPAGGAPLVTVDGSGLGDSVVYVEDGIATLRDMTITGGTAVNGGGIYVEGTLILDGVSVEENLAGIVQQDQGYDSTDFVTGSCGGSYFQGFTPTDDLLSSVRLSYRTNGVYTGSTLEVRIREGGPAGPTVGTSIVDVPASVGSGAQIFVDFPFFPAVPTTSASTYVIEWVNGGAVSWYFNDTTYPPANPYVGGSSWVDCGGGLTELPDRDYDFATFGLAAGGFSDEGGGGLYLAQESQATLIDSTITRNSAGSNGGGVQNSLGHIEVLSSSVTDNVSGNSGGGIATVGDVCQLACTLIVENGEVSGNQALGNGGGIWSGGDTVMITDSVIHSNTAGANGGGVASEGDPGGPADLSVVNSAVFDNEAGNDGGGIHSIGYSAAVFAENSTLSGNSADHFGGGIYSNSQDGVILNSATITNNSTPSNTGGIEMAAWGSLSMSNSILSGNLPANSFTDCRLSGTAFIDSVGYNLVGTTSQCAGFTATGDITGVTNPQVGPLTDNGGPTPTHALLAGSPAIDAGHPGTVQVELTNAIINSQLQSNGAASQGASEISVVNGSFTVGSVYATALSEGPFSLNESFSTTFDFRITDPTPYLSEPSGDGFAFAISPSQSLLGEAAGRLGVATTPGPLGTVSVEFDTYFNGGDISTNHIGINVGGFGDGQRVISDVQAAIPGQFDDGSTWTAWIDYIADSNLLEVRVDAGGTRPAAAQLSHVVDIALEVGPTGYYGFAGGTGLAQANHRVSAWELTTFSCPDTDQRGIDRFAYAPCDIGAYESEVAAVVPEVGFSVASAPAVEGGPHTVDVELTLADGSLTSPVSVSVSDLGSGTATAGADYTLDTALVTFPTGSVDGATQQVDVTITGSDGIEPNETLTLGLSNPTGGATLIAPTEHVVTITEGGVLGSVSMTTSTPEVEALGFIPFSELDPIRGLRSDATPEEVAGVGAGISSIGAGISSIGAPISSIGAVISSIGAPISSIGAGISSIGAGISSIGAPISSINVLSIGAPISSIGAGISSIGAPISSIGAPISSIGAVISSIGAPISSIPITNPDKGTWEDRLVGTPYGGTPLNSVPFGVLFEDDLTRDAIFGGPDPLTLADIDLSSTEVGSLSTLSFTLGNLTLGQVETVTGGDVQVAEVCTAQGCGSSTTIVEADLGGNNLAAIGAPISSIDINNVVLSQQPIGQVTVNSIGAGISSIALGLIVDCGFVDAGVGLPAGWCGDLQADPTGFPQLTLAEAQVLGILQSPLTIGEVFILSLPVPVYDWTDLPVEDLALDSGPVVSYAVTFNRGAGDLPGTVTVDLPAGVRYASGSAEVASGPLGQPLGDPLEQSDPVIEGDGSPAAPQQLTWTVPTLGGFRYRLGFDGRVGVVELGTYRADAAVTVGAETRTKAQVAPVSVVENFELVVPVGSEPGTPAQENAADNPVVASTDGLFVSYINAIGDADYFELPGVAAGNRVRVLLDIVGDDSDSDVVMYQPLSEFAPKADTREFSDGGTQVPLVEDEGRHADSTVDLAPETANDVASVGAGISSIGAGISSIGAGISSIGAGISSIGSNRGSASEVVESDGGGDVGIVVTGFNGSTGPYVVQWQEIVVPEVSCGSGLTFPEGSGTYLVPAGTSVPTAAEMAAANTLIVVNEQRLAAVNGGEASAVITSLNNLVTALNGPLSSLGLNPVIVYVEADPAVQQAYYNWDANYCSPDYANDVVNAINEYIDSLLPEEEVEPGVFEPNWTQIESITLIGPDSVIPFQRVVDGTLISNETDFAAALYDPANTEQSAIYGALAAGYTLTDDFYAAYSSIYPSLNGPRAIPDWAVGRLVESTEQISDTIDQYVANGGVLNTDPGVTALSTGYDFLTDGAERTTEVLTGAGITTTDLISDLWDKDDLGDALFPTTGAPDLISLSAHFDDQVLVPAVSGVGEGPEISPDQAVFTISEDLTDLLSLNPDGLQNRVVFTVGCHAGLNNPIRTDWAEAFLSEGAVLIANLGYGYGLDGAVGLSEKLYNELLASNLDGSLTLGEALAYSKQLYNDQKLVYGAYDEKVLAQATLFGLPFYWLTGATPTGPTPPPVVSGDQVAAIAPVHVESYIGDDPASNRYFADEGQTPTGQTAELHNRPIQPAQVLSYATTDGTQATGVLITDLTTSDLGPFDAAYARPIFDDTDFETELETPGTIFPNTFATVNSRQTPDGTVSNVVVATGQFISDETSAVGTQRLFDSVGAEVLFDGPAGPGDGPPVIESVDAVLGNPSLTFEITVEDPDVDQVYVLYKEAAFQDNATWFGVDLVETAPGVWTLVIPLTAAQEEWEQVEYFVQARKGKYVGTSYNKGVLYAAKLVGAGADSSALEGDLVPLAGATFVDPLADSAPSNAGDYVATVDWGDGSSPSTATVSDKNDSTAFAIDADHTYTQDAVYQVEVCVSKTASETELGCDVAIVEVENAAPSVEAINAAAQTSGGATLTAAVSDPGLDDILSASIDWGDDTPAQPVEVDEDNAVTAVHTYASAATYTVKVTVSDGTAEGVLTEPVTVAQPPAGIVLNGPLTVQEGTTATYSFTITGGGTVTAGPTPSCGTGTVVGSVVFADPSGEFECAFPNGPDAAEVSIEATVGTQTVGDNLTVDVRDVLPALTVEFASLSVDEGSEASNSGTFFDAGGDVVTITASIGTVTQAAGTYSWSYSPPDGLANETVTITAATPDGNSTAVFDLTVQNIVPDIDLQGPNVTTAGSTESYSYTVSDPGDDGDGRTTDVIGCGAGSVLSAEVTGPNGGTFQCTFNDSTVDPSILIQVTDDDGTFAETFLVEVLDGTPPVIAVPADITVEAQGPDGATVAFNPIPTAVDDVDGPVVVSCSAETGSLFDLGVTEVTCSASDAAGNEAAAAFDVLVEDTTPPAITLNPDPIVVLEVGGTYVDAGATVSDIVDPAPTVLVDNPVNTAVAGEYTVRYNATDAALNAANEVTRTVWVVDPLVINGPIDPTALGLEISVSALITDTGLPTTATIDWGETSSSPVTVTLGDLGDTLQLAEVHLYADPGVYAVTVTVDYDGLFDQVATFEYAVIYDPNGGFVTGGGWIDSPSGAFTPDNSDDEDFVGKASFGFVSKYKKGQSTPSGNTTFKFKAADFKFKSTTYDWLVITNSKAQYKGNGLVNGELAPNGEEYKFKLTGFDADVKPNDSHEDDEFRIKIWYEVGEVEIVVYDNGLGQDDTSTDDDVIVQSTTVLSGGSIRIHQPKGKK